MRFASLPRPERSRRRARRLVLESLEPRHLLSANGADTRHYRLAVTASEEYTAFFGTREAAQAAIERTIADVNRVFRRELNMQLDLIDSLPLIFGPGNSPDPFPSGGPGFVPNQTLQDATIGPANYDVGILLGGIAVGVAFLGGAGMDGNKAKAFSGFTADEGGPAGANAVDNALHEIAHQFGANHTVNGTLSTCASGRTAINSYEPGSGSTLVGYAGICGGDSVQPNSDFYYHFSSLDEMIAHMTMLDGLGVGTKELGVNSVPTVSAGPNFTIPARTPFALTATGADADDPSGHSLRYTIEQRDLGPAQTLAPFPGDNGTSPLFRSFPPTAAKDGGYTRLFPQLSDILANTTTIGEYLPTTTRALNFRATVRDGVGGTSGDDVLLSVVDTGAPFKVTSQNTSVTLTGGTSQTITWDVAGTSANGINTASVNIRLSTDGGQTFPHLLATTANDGAHDIMLPNVDTTTARIKVEGVGNIFFDISDVNFQILPAGASPGVAIDAAGGLFVGERGEFSSATATYTLALRTIPASPVTITVTADEFTEVSVNGATFASSASFTRSDLASQVITVRAIDDTHSFGAHTSTIRHAVTAGTDPAYSSSLVIDSIQVQVADDEQPPLIGLDFQPASLKSPLNWTTVTSLSTSVPTTLSNLKREDGAATTVDLVFTPTVGSSTSTTADRFGSLTAPLHAPDLNLLDGVLYFDQFFSPALPAVSLNATWKSLTPGRRYNVYLMAHEHFGLSFTAAPWFVNQRITITGDGSDNPPPFMQNSTGKQRQLLVNDMEGDDRLPLEAFAKTVTASPSGEINIEIFRDDGVDANRIIIGGLAISEVSTELPNLAPFQITLSHTTAFRGLPGAWVAEVAVGDSNAGDDHTFTLSDARFIVENGSLFLKPGMSIGAGETSVSLSITATDTGTPPLSFSQDFVLTTVDSPGFACAHQWGPNQYDVNADGSVTPLDSLLIINDLNEFGSRPLPLLTPGTAPPPFLDVSCDDTASPLDALLIINELNDNGESEAPLPLVESTAPAMLLPPVVDDELSLANTFDDFDARAMAIWQLLLAYDQNAWRPSDKLLRDSAMADDRESFEGRNDGIF